MEKGRDAAKRGTRKNQGCFACKGKCTCGKHGASLSDLEYAAQDGLRRALMEERLEAEQLVARVDQALRERGKGVDRKLVRELKNQMSAVAKCVTRIKPDKLDEGQLNDLRAAVDQLKRSPALAALGGVN